MDTKTTGKSFFFAAIRTVIGVVFIHASIDKICAPALFANSIQSYRVILQPDILKLLATIIPWLELVCGFCLVLNTYVRGSSILISFLLIVFIVAIGQGMYRGLDISCGCFTQDPTASRIGFQKLGEDILLLCGSLLLVKRKTPPPAAGGNNYPKPWWVT